MSNPEGIRLVCEGRTMYLKPGRVSPGNPPEHVVDAAGKHVSLAFRERDGSVLFDAEVAGGERAGYRMHWATGQVDRFPTKGAYWAARSAAGWPARRKAKA